MECETRAQPAALEGQKFVLKQRKFKTFQFCYWKLKVMIIGVSICSEFRCLHWTKVTGSKASNLRKRPLLHMQLTEPRTNNCISVSRSLISNVERMWIKWNIWNRVLIRWRLPRVALRCLCINCLSDSPEVHIITKNSEGKNICDILKSIWNGGNCR